MTVTQKPYILVCATPVYGHMMPIRAIAKDLISRGYDITFLTGSHYKSIIEAIGATFEPLEGYCDFTEGDVEARWPERKTIPDGPPQFAWDMENMFVNCVPSQYQSVQRVLKKLTAQKDPNRPLILVNEMAFLGTLPIKLGAPGLTPDAVISISIVPLVLSSIDCGPFGPGQPPDSSPAGREKNIAANKFVQEVFMKAVQDKFISVCTSLGASTPKHFFLDAPFHLSDRTLQMCIPSVEYPRSDMPPTVRFAGGLPKGKRDPWLNKPAWWDEVAVNPTGKRIVAVSQGSLAGMNYDDLVVPTLTALADIPHVLVVAALGRAGASLSPSTPIPENARVLDFIPFDDLFQHSALFVTNGGYGGFQHAISNGIPLVIAGGTEDKPEIAARAEWAGVAVNLKTGKPTTEQVRQGVLEVLLNGKYTARARELQEEMRGYDPLGCVVETVEEFAARARGEVVRN